MSLFFYARVSSKGQNLDRQLARAKDAKADKVFQDKFSGKNTDRPGLKTRLEASEMRQATLISLRFTWVLAMFC